MTPINMLSEHIKVMGYALGISVEDPVRDQVRRGVWFPVEGNRTQPSLREEIRSCIR